MILKNLLPSKRKMALTALIVGIGWNPALAQDAAPQPDPYKLQPTTKPLVIRSFIEDSPARSIAVGFPQGVHYCLNGNSGKLEYVWIGGFLDVGPDRGRGRGRGGKPNKILGQRKDLNLPAVPIRFTGKEKGASARFKGYRRGVGAPEVLMEWQGKSFKQIIRPALGGIGVTVRYEFEEMPEGSLQIYAPVQGWKTTSTLKLPEGTGWLSAEKQMAFEVTYLDQ